MIKYILLIVLSLRLVFSLFYDFIFFFFFIIIYIFFFFFFFSSRRRHTRSYGDWSRRVLFRSGPRTRPASGRWFARSRRSRPCVAVRPFAVAGFIRPDFGRMNPATTNKSNESHRVVVFGNRF